MKKKLLHINLIIMIFLIPLQVPAQYIFETFEREFTALENANILTQNTHWDDEVYQVSIGFEFPYFGKLYNKINISDYVYFNNDFIDPLYIDFVGRDDTLEFAIAYELKEINGDSVFVIEWRNAGSFCESYKKGSTEDYFNTQLWLYQYGAIEIHVGPSSVNNNPASFCENDGPYLGLWDQNNLVHQSVFAGGDPDNPFIVLNDSSYNTTLQGMPEKNRVYRFSKDHSTNTTPFPELGKTDVKVFPNPAFQYINVQMEGIADETAQFNIYDVSGRRVLDEQLFIQKNSEKIELDISSFAQGLYMLTIQTFKSDQVITRKFIKGKE